MLPRDYCANRIRRSCDSLFGIGLQFPVADFDDARSPYSVFPFVFHCPFKACAAPHGAADIFFELSTIHSKEAIDET
jgi:hypothetical protein